MGDNCSSILSDEDLEGLRAHCKAFRTAIKSCPTRALPITLQEFPRGACGDAALLLAKYLEGEGFGSFDYMLGQRDGRSHAWLQRENLVIDITGDQFADMPSPVFVEHGSPWHEAFAAEVEYGADFNIFDPYTRALLGGAYAMIREYLPAAPRQMSSTTAVPE